MAGVTLCLRVMKAVVPAVTSVRGWQGTLNSWWAVAAMPALTTAVPRPWRTALARWNRESVSSTTLRLSCWRATASSKWWRNCMVLLGRIRGRDCRSANRSGSPVCGPVPSTAMALG
ncbi:hypothetical protein D3C78_1689250 [compost metagenome]